MKRIAVYGSLRPGEYNYKYYVKLYGENAMKKIGQLHIYGYKLYSLGSYPAIKESPNYERVVVDVLEVTDEVFDYITRMEIGAGYNIKVIQTFGYETVLYVYQGSVKEEHYIRHGDWSQHLEEIVKQKIEHSYEQ